MAIAAVMDKILRYSVLFSSIALGLSSVTSAQTPQPAPLRPIITPHFDSKAVALLEYASRRLREASTLEAVVRVQYRRLTDTSVSGNTSRVRYMRPGYYYISRQYDKKRYASSTLITPTDCIRYDGANKAFRCNRETALLNNEPDVTLRGFLDTRQNSYWDEGEWHTDRLHDPLVRSVIYMGRETTDSTIYDIVEWEYELAYTLPEDTVVYRSRVYIDDDGLVRKVLTTNNKGYQITREVLIIKINAPITEKDFAWEAPQGVTIVDARDRRWSFPTLVGETYPEFATPGQILDGPRVTASELLSGKKGAFIWFWNTTCSSCIAEMPHFEQIYREFKDKGIAVIAVNVVKDTAELSRARRNVAFNRITMPILFNADSWGERLEKTVLAVLDGQGKVVLDDYRDGHKLYSAIKQLAENGKVYHNVELPVPSSVIKPND